MKRIGRGFHKMKMLVECPCLFVLGMNGERSNPGNIGGLQSAKHGVPEKASADAFSLPCRIYAYSGKQHQRHGMTSKSLGQAFRCIFIAHLTCDQRIKSDNFFIRKAKIRLRNACLLVPQCKPHKKTVEVFLSAIKLLDGVMTREFFNPKLTHVVGDGSKMLGSRNNRRKRGLERGGASRASMKAVQDSALSPK
jgi:hypothetical protein